MFLFCYFRYQQLFDQDDNSFFAEKLYNSICIHRTLKVFFFKMDISVCLTLAYRAAVPQKMALPLESHVLQRLVMLLMYYIFYQEITIMPQLRTVSLFLRHLGLELQCLLKVKQDLS